MTRDANPYALIGQFDSPFVRRVAVTLGLYEIPFEHRNWSVFRDSEKIAAYNPMRRVPVLVLPSGEALVESSAIIDYLDEQVSEDRVLLPRSGPERYRGLRVCAQAVSLADKGVALVYENVAREVGTQSRRWTERCRLQVSETLMAFEKERASIQSHWWLGEKVGHPDLAVGIVLHFLEQGVPQLVSELPLPALRAHKERCRELRPFIEYDDPLHFPE
jgi:glutathione S-transferase